MHQIKESTAGMRPAPDLQRSHILVNLQAFSFLANEITEILSGAKKGPQRINKLTKLGRCDRETIEWANNSNDSIVRTAGRVSK